MSGRNKMRTNSFAVLVICVLTVAIGIEVFKWKECRKVGHSFVYCVFRSASSGGVK